MLGREFRFLAQPLNLWSRLLLLAAAVDDCYVDLFSPLWKMHLVAPQYSDGLDFFIYSYKIVGGGLNGQHLDEINNLNHYIGMAPIQQADFLEMRWMPFIFGLITLMILRSVVFGQMGNLVDLFVVYCYFGIFSIGSFWYRLYTIWAQSRSARADAHQAVHAAADRRGSKSQISASHSYPQLGAYLLCFSVLLIVLAGWFSRKESMNAMGSARILRAGEGLRRSRTFLGTARFPQDDESLGKSSFRQDAETSTLQACAPRIIATLLFVTTYAGAATLQERIDAAAPNETIRVEAGVHAGPIIINKPLTLIGENGAEIRGNGFGNVVTIAADDVTLRGLRITGSGLRLSDDDAAVFVTGNRAKVEKCVIADSLHGIYLKKISGAQILNNRIQGKTTLTASTEPVEKGIGTSTENCDTTLVSNRRGNGIHQWNCEGNLIRGNEISDTRDGIYFSFTNNSRVENNLVHHVRYGLHYMYSDGNVFENNTFSENAAGAAIMFSKELVVRGNRFINNRGHRAYGLIFQSSDRSRLEKNEITQNAVGLSFNQCNENQIAGNRVMQNYIGLRFGSNSDGNRFTENVFMQNLHPVETGASDVSGSRWAVNGVGNFWDGSFELDLDRDGVNDLPHRELDLFGVLRRDFPAVAFLSDSPALKLLRFAEERAALPGISYIEDPAPLNSHFWKVRAQRAARATQKIADLPNER